MDIVMLTLSVQWVFISVAASINFLQPKYISVANLEKKQIYQLF